MCWKDFMIWKKKSKTPVTNKKFKLYIYQCYLVKTKNGRIMFSSKCSVCNINNWNFLKNKKLEGY